MTDVTRYMWNFMITFLYSVNVPARPRFGPRGGAPPRHSGKSKSQVSKDEKQLVL